MYTHLAWRRCAARFSEVKHFIDESAKTIKHGVTASYRADLYGSWVLMAYSACQYSLAEIGRGCLEFLGKKYKYSARLPAGLYRGHVRAGVDAARQLIERGEDIAQVVRSLQSIHSRDWSLSSSLLLMERNVWPHHVQEWLRRLGVEDRETRWMQTSAPTGTDTYQSRMQALIEERNPIAHGRSPSAILSSGLMLDWLKDCQSFMEQCAMTVELRLATHHRPKLATLGPVDASQKLGEKTVAISELATEVLVGDHLVLEAGQARWIARVESMMSNGVGAAVFVPGATRVAIRIDRKHRDGNLFQTP